MIAEDDDGGSFLPSVAAGGDVEGPPRFRRGKLPLVPRQGILAEIDAEELFCRQMGEVGQNRAHLARLIFIKH